MTVHRARLAGAGLFVALLLLMLMATRPARAHAQTWPYAPACQYSATYPVYDWYNLWIYVYGVAANAQPWGCWYSTPGGGLGVTYAQGGWVLIARYPIWPRQ